MQKRFIHVSLVFTFIIIILSIAQLQASETKYCVIISNELNLKDNPEDYAKNIKKIDRKFWGKSYDIIDETGNFYKIKIDGISGWIKGKKGKTILKNATNETLITAEKTNLLYKKCIIVNKIEANQSKIDIKIFPNSDLTGEPIGRITLFELRFIFSETDKSILIGKSELLGKRNSDIILIGWINKNNIYKWNNRVGVEFDKRNFDTRINNLGVIYYSEVDVRNSAKTKEVETLCKEESTNQEMPYYANRFPMIEKKNYRNMEFYKIAFIGGGESNGKFYSDADITFNKEKISQLLNNKYIQLAILIDATKGMGSHIKNVKNAIKDFFKYVKNDNNENLFIKIAIAVYRDYPDCENIWEIKCDFTNNFDKLSQAIDSITTKSNKNDYGIGAFPEAMFYGLDHTIRTSKIKNPFEWVIYEKNTNNKIICKEKMDVLSWGGMNGEKYIIHIGDHGNHEDYSQYDYDKKYSENKLIEKLKNNFFSLYTIQVNVADSSNNMFNYNKIFEKQIYRIVGESNIFGTLQKVSTNSTKKIFDLLKNAFLNFKTLRELFFKTRDGRLDIEGYSGPFTQKILERYGIDPNIFQTVQGCAIGFVKKYNNSGQNQIQERVLLKKNDIDTIKVQMNILSGMIYKYDKLPANSSKILKDVIKGVVHALSGDNPGPDELISDFIEKKTGIPVITEILDTTVDAFVKTLKNSKEKRLEAYKYFKTKVMKLEEVMKERKLDDDVDWDPDSGSLNYDFSDIKKPYFFSLEQPIPERGKIKIKDSKKQHVWLPLEYLP